MRGNHAVIPRRAHAGLFMCVMLALGCEGSTEPLVGIRLEAVSPTTLTGQVAMEITPAPTVRATNLAGAPVSGLRISFHASGSGAVGDPSVTTDADGMAVAGRWTLGTRVGTYTLSARSAGLPDVLFTATAEAGFAAKITGVQGNFQTAAAGARLRTPLRVRVTDSLDNPVPGTVVMITVVSGGGSVAGGMALSDANGIVTSGAWTLGATPGQQQLSFQHDGAKLMYTAYACGPECRQIAFERGGELYRIGLDGTGEVLISNAGRESHPAWSPDGQRIAFVRYDRDWGGGIYLMDADGFNVRLRVSSDFHSPAWSPDGRTLAVARGRVYYGEIYLLSVDGNAAPVLLTKQATEPSWSPDGKKLAFVSLSGDDGYHALHVINADGTQLSELTVRDEGAIDRPTWSPDGRRIAFSKCISGRCDLYSVKADGSGLTELTRVGNAVSPAWSPDGTRIAFTLFSYARGAYDWSLAHVAADGQGDPFPLGIRGAGAAWRP